MKRPEPGSVAEAVDIALSLLAILGLAAFAIWVWA